MLELTVLSENIPGSLRDFFSRDIEYRRCFS